MLFLGELHFSLTLSCFSSEVSGIYCTWEFSCHLIWHTVLYCSTNLSSFPWDVLYSDQHRINTWSIEFSREKTSDLPPQSSETALEDEASIWKLRVLWKRKWGKDVTLSGAGAEWIEKLSLCGNERLLPYSFFNLICLDFFGGFLFYFLQLWFYLPWRNVIKRCKCACSFP